MWKTRITAVLILLVGFGVGFFVYKSELARFNPDTGVKSGFLSNFPFRLGLDLSGGTHLVYQADVSVVKSGEVSDSMNALRDVIERRVNLFGVSEPVVQIQEGGIGAAKGDQKLIVDLPGVTDVSKAVEMIGQTPLLEFRIENPNPTPQNMTVDKDGNAIIDPSSLNDQFIATDLTGRYLEKATLEFDQNTGEPRVALQFNKEGSDLFAKITKENVGKMVAIFLDGSTISTPVVNEEITGGKAVISGSFTAKEAKLLVGRLNSGALPVPISLVSTQTIGASLGEQAVKAGAHAALIGLLVIAIFLILWYRLPGIIAVIALAIYVSLMLAIFKLIPVTLTAASIAGFIISIGLAVDANILIFERLKEEVRAGRNITEATKNGFSRAWFAIRDSNIAHIITGVILFWLGTPLIKGFALVFILGVLVSMFSAITVSRIFLYSFKFKNESKFMKFLFSSGLSK
ncbi:MAG: protein translocase subunit SecD [Candidatus Paceibacterota bacterium]